MKKYVIVFLAMMLSACQSFIGAKVTVYPANDVVVVNQQESVLDAALPTILAKAEVNHSSVPTPSIIESLQSNPPLPEAVDNTIESKVRQFSEEDLRCLAVNIYHESRGEPEKGQAAVAYVVLNRVESGRYRESICGVVYQYGYRRGKKVCQFSWACDRLPDVPRDQNAYAQAQRIATLVLSGEYNNPIGSRLSFHSTQITSRYSARSKNRLRVGGHLFY